MKEFPVALDVLYSIFVYFFAHYMSTDNNNIHMYNMLTKSHAHTLTHTKMHL